MTIDIEQLKADTKFFQFHLNVLLNNSGPNIYGPWLSQSICHLDAVQSRILSDAETIADLEAEIASLRKQVKPKVKPLVWHEWPEGRSWKARCALGSYHISHDEKIADAYWLEGRVVRRLFKTLEAAKAAAQADYERRILDALELPSTHPSRTQEDK